MTAPKTERLNRRAHGSPLDETAVFFMQILEKGMTQMKDSEAYKKYLSGVFTRASPCYNQVGPSSFTPFGKRLVEFARISPRTRVLDVACGRGAVLFPAQSIVGESGEVIGIDISDGMIEEINKDITLRGLANASAVKMDAERLGFPDSTFDTVLCGLGLFFLPDLEGALAGFLRVLKPGGWLVASTFQRIEEKDEANKRWDAMMESFKERLKPVPEAQTTRMGSADEITQVLSRAGFQEIEIASDQETFYYTNEAEWWLSAWSAGFRGFLERMEADTFAQFKQQATEIILLEKTERGIPDTWYLLYSKGKKPG